MKLFSLLAGKSDHTFEIDGVNFSAAPMTLDEQAGYYALMNEKGVIKKDELADYLAKHLKMRVIGTKSEDHDKVTGAWLRAVISEGAMLVIRDLLLVGDHEKKMLEEKVAAAFQKKS